MDASLSDHITKLNKLSYKNQRVYIAKELSHLYTYTHFIVLKKLQIILADLPDTLNDFIKNLSIGNEAEYKYCFNNLMFDNYFFHRIEPYITIYCRRLSQDEYLLTIPINN